MSRATHPRPARPGAPATRVRAATAARAAALALALLAGAAPPSAAQPALPRLAGFASVSPRLAPEAFRDEYRTGLGGGAGIEAPWRRRLTVVGWISLDHFRLNSAFVESEIERVLRLPAVDISGGGVNVITTMVGLRLHAPDVQRPLPYAEALGGVVYLGANDARVNGAPVDLSALGATDGQVAWALGVGVRRQRAGQLGFALSAHVVGTRLQGRSLGFCPVRLSVILPS